MPTNIKAIALGMIVLLPLITALISSSPEYNPKEIVLLHERSQHGISRQTTQPQVVLMELFTSTTCNPCVNADTAAEWLLHNYTRDELIVLEYHENIPAPDYLTNPDTEARLDFYSPVQKSTPTVVFNGQNKSSGSQSTAEATYNSYNSSVSYHLTQTPAFNLTLSGTSSGNTYNLTARIKANQNVVQLSADNVQLYFVLFEDHIWVEDALNGVKHQRYTVRKIISIHQVATTTTIPAGYETNISLNYSITDEEIIPAQTGIVAFIQNNQSKQIYQSDIYTPGARSFTYTVPSNTTSVKAGQSAAFQVKVANTGPMNDRYWFSIYGEVADKTTYTLTGSGVTLKNNSIDVPKGQTATFNLTTSFEDNAYPRNYTYSFRLDNCLVPELQNTKITSFRIQVTENLFRAFTFNSTQTAFQGPAGTTYSIRIDLINNGTLPDTYNLLIISSWSSWVSLSLNP
ncbi:MAG: hypothetical protein QW728_04310, partial [Thermoplasmata archaeon]